MLSAKPRAFDVERRGAVIIQSKMILNRKVTKPHDSGAAYTILYVRRAGRLRERKSVEYNNANIHSYISRVTTCEKLGLKIA